MTTDLLPFDLETALREPERVRHVDYSTMRATQIARFPAADKFCRVAVLWRGDGMPTFYSECGRRADGMIGQQLGLALKTRKVWVRIMGRDATDFATHIEFHPGCSESLPKGWRWLDAGPTEIEIREDA